MELSQGARITWLGHATVLIQTAKGTNILIDPFIADNPKSAYFLEVDKSRQKWIQSGSK